MNRKPVLAALLLAAAPIALAATAPGDHSKVTRTFSRSVPAAGLESVKLDVSVGTVHITAANADTVRVQAEAEPADRMHFIFDWTAGPGANRLPADLHLVTARRGTQLVVSLESASDRGSVSFANPAASANEHHGFVVFDSDGSSGWKADWTLVLPARLALTLTAGVGSADISGIAGGLDAKVGVGHLDAELPRGPVTADVGVGNISTTIASADYGDVALTAGVGDVKFAVNGRENTTGYEHQFTAASQHLSGPGRTAYTLKAGVGHVDLELGVKGTSRGAAQDESGDDEQ